MQKKTQKVIYKSQHSILKNQPSAEGLAANLKLSL